MVQPQHTYNPAQQFKNMLSLTTEGSPAEAIEALEAQMKEMPQLDIKEKHYFSKGVYAREITIPKGATLTGKVHKFENLNIISKGKIVITTDEGTQILEAPCTLVSPPGTKRAGHALEETVWTTIHGTDETDLKKLEQHFVTDTRQQFLAFAQQRLEA